MIPDLLVLRQSVPPEDENFAAQNLRRFTESAKLAGCKVVDLPATWDEHSPDEVLPRVEGKTQAVFVGYISENEYYETLYEACSRANIQLQNTPDQSIRAMEFEQFYPLIQDFTPRSLVVENREDLPKAVAELGFPLFVKGGIKSTKESGWDSCVVNNLEDLEARFDDFSRRPLLARRITVLRQLAPLRKSGQIVGGFPESREYRTFLINAEIVGYGYYWRSEDPFGVLDDKDRNEMLSIARIVVEVADLQYTGVAQMSHLVFWNELRKTLN